MVKAIADWDQDSLAIALGCEDAEMLERRLGAISTGSHLQRVLEQGRKRRVLAIPHDWLALLQRAAIEAVFPTIPISSATYSTRGRNVVENARRHLHNPYMTVLDVEDCFPSTTVSMVRDSFLRAGLQPSVARRLTRLTTFRGLLQQGPPTSPAVQNVVFTRIDAEMSELAARYDAVYTRYGDDLAFSSGRPLVRIARTAPKVLKQFGYNSNPSKRRIWGPRDRHTVTKIVVSSSLNATPEFLENLTRHLVAMRRGKSSLTSQQIRGKIEWVAALNPPLGASLRAEFRRYASTEANTRLEQSRS